MQREGAETERGILCLSCLRSTNLPLEGIDDELEVKRVDALDALLDDVVAVLVLDALEHVSFQFGDDELSRGDSFS